MGNYFTFIGGLDSFQISIAFPKYSLENPKEVDLKRNYDYHPGKENYDSHRIANTREERIHKNTGIPR